MARVKGRWSGRPSKSDIEKQAVSLVAEFERSLASIGLEVPVIPPIPVEYVALTLTEFNVRGVDGLSCDGQKLSGFLDTQNEEICYEENEASVRQNFTIAHELGHYYLHYLPELEGVKQPTLFSLDEVSAAQPIRFYRCSDHEVIEAVGEEDEVANDGMPPSWVSKSKKTYLNDAEAQSKLAKVIRLKERANRFEWEANVFATALLMPKELVNWLYQKYEGDISKMALEMNVSQAALRYRLKDMRLPVDGSYADSRQKTTQSKPFSDFNQGSFL